jgi:uncharacterized OsmC-like protein
MDLISVTREHGLEFKVAVRGHKVTSDMSVNEGGQDAGPSPAEFLAGSLGACIAMMVQGYCDRHEYTDGEVSVSLTLELADDPKRISNIVVDVELPKGIPQDRWGGIRRIAEHCTIHETLRNPPLVDIDFV